MIEEDEEVYGFGFGFHTQADVENVRKMNPASADKMTIMLVTLMAILVWKPPQADE